jgi:LysM domain-containing protein
MEEQPDRRERRILTPAVLASALFVAACATFAISFVAARGGLQLPVGATPPPVALASPEPTAEPTGLPTPGPLSSPEPTLPPSEAPVPSAEPTVAPTEVAGFALPTFKPNDPLLALDPCPGHPACARYVVQRGDTMNRILNRYDLKLDVVLALNPKLEDPSLIVVGQTLYLGRNRFARLDPCPNGERCFLYVVVKGDSVKDIAARYDITEKAILNANPTMPHPIVPDLVLKLPYPG